MHTLFRERWIGFQAASWIEHLSCLALVTLAVPNTVRQTSCDRVAYAVVVCATGAASAVVVGRRTLAKPVAHEKLLSSFVSHRDPRWFDDPERFEPERFLHNRADEIQNGAYFPFGAGPRVCIGQSFAMTEMVLVAASMLQTCNVELVPERADLTLHDTMALRPKEQLMIRWKRREN